MYTLNLSFNYIVNFDIITMYLTEEIELIDSAEEIRKVGFMMVAFGTHLISRSLQSTYRSRDKNFCENSDR